MGHAEILAEIVNHVVLGRQADVLKCLCSSIIRQYGNTNFCNCLGIRMYRGTDCQEPRIMMHDRSQACRSSVVSIAGPRRLEP